jgi:hypothetical protein
MSTPAAGAAGALGKGGKPVMVKDKARAEFLAVMAARLDEIRHSRDAYRPEDQHVGAEVILSIEGMGFQDPTTREFTTKKPGATKGKSAHHYSAASFVEQFYITVGSGPGFAHHRLVVVSNPIFFKDGDASTKKAKILGGHDPILKVGDFVFTKSNEGGATYASSTGSGRFSGVTEYLAMTYSDLYAVLPKADATEWIKSGFMLM